MEILCGLLNKEQKTENFASKSERVKMFIYVYLFHLCSREIRVETFSGVFGSYAKSC
jgi:hypothetical protein